MSDKNTIDVYNEQANEYSEMCKSLKPTADLANFIAALVPNSLVLDLGCGPAHTSAALVKEGFQVEATDASPAMVKMANETFGIHAQQAEFNDLNAELRYDGVWANFSLLHATAEDFPKHLHAIHRALKPAGVFHIGMKTGANSARDSLGRFYTYYSEQHHLNNAGFSISASRTGEERGLSGSLDSYAVMLCQKV